MNNKTVEDKILKAVNDFNMLPCGSTVVVGLSGGKDSMVLIHFLLKIKSRLNLNIIASHINHNLRGEESQIDENFVKKFCEGNNIKLEVLSVKVKEEAKKFGCGLEECGRKVRYAFFNELAAFYNGKIAVAHTLSDSVETVLLNLTRGAGLHGLCGIAPVRGNIIRPLIYLTSDEVRFYCSSESIAYVEDSTNALEEYTRNKIRLNIIPQLKKINPAMEESFLRSSKLLKQDNDYLNKAAKTQLEQTLIGDNKYDVSKLKAMDISILQRCIRLSLQNFKSGRQLSCQHIELVVNIILNNGGTVNLPGQIFAKVTNESLEFFKPTLPEVKWEMPLIKGDTDLTVNNLNVIIKVIGKNEYDYIVKTEPFFSNKAIDCDKLSKSVVFRNRRAGDKIHLPYRNITKSLKKFFNEEKVSAGFRDKLALLAKNNEVLWIEKFGASEDLKVTENTKNVMIINCRRKQEC